MTNAGQGRPVRHVIMICSDDVAEVPSTAHWKLDLFLQTLRGLIYMIVVEPDLYALFIAGPLCCESLLKHQGKR